MTYSVKRVGIKSVAIAAFVCMIFVMSPLLPFMLLVEGPPYLGIGRTSSLWLDHLFSTISGLLVFALVVALSASIVAVVYNLSVRFHGGIDLDIELKEAQLPEKKKN